MLFKKLAVLTATVLLFAGFAMQPHFVWRCGLGWLCQCCWCLWGQRAIVFRCRRCWLAVTARCSSVARVPARGNGW